MNTQDIIKVVQGYKAEAKLAQGPRTEKNRYNIQMYNLQQDMSHKKLNQSREFLPRLSNSVEQTVAFFRQGLADVGVDWFSMQIAPGVTQPWLTAAEAKSVFGRQLEKAEFYKFVGDAFKQGLLTSRIIAKVCGKYVDSPTFYSRKRNGTPKLYKRKNTHWQLDLKLVDFENFFCDPTGRDLYKIETCYYDLHELYDLQDYYGFSSEALAALAQSLSKQDQKPENAPVNSARKQVELQEFWGTIVDPTTGKAVHRNVTCVIANGTHMLLSPTPYPSWLGEDPYVVAQVITHPFSMEDEKAWGDAPARLNRSLNELFNLMFDGGIQDVFGISQVRTHWMDDPAQVADGIYPGLSVGANASCPPGAAVIERVPTGSTTGQANQAYQLASGEYNQSAMQSDLRVGVLPAKAVKSTEVVASENSINSTYTDMAHNLEGTFIEKVFYKAWNLTIQNMDDLNTPELKALLTEKRAEELAKVSPEERFAQAVNGHKFKVFGITQTLNKIKDFRKVSALLQTIMGSQVLMQEFSRKYSFEKLLGVIMESLDVNLDKIKVDETEADVMAMATGMPDMSKIPDLNSEQNLDQQPEIESDAENYQELE